MEPANRPATLCGDGSSRGSRVLAGRFVAICSWMSLAVCVGAWILLRAGDLWGPATALMFGPRWLLVLPPLFLIPLAAKYRRRSLAPLLLTVILVVGPVMGFRIPWSRLVSGSPPGPRLRVLTCNIHAAKVDPARLDGLISELRPDVVALQLWRDSAHSDVLDAREWHVHRIPGLFLASRYPILRTELLGIDSDGTDGSVMRYELKMASGVVNIFSLHLATPREGLEALAHRSWSGMAELDAGSALRREQSERLAAKAANATGPILLVGDFNTPPESADFSPRLVALYRCVRRGRLGLGLYV